MYDLDLMDEFDDDFGDAFDAEDMGYDSFDFEDEFDDEDEFDAWTGHDTLGLILSAAGNIGGNVYKNSKFGKKVKKKSRGWDAVLQGLLGGLTKAGSAYMGGREDEAEPEYETDAIGDMEAMAEGTLHGHADPRGAADEMSRIAFGPSRADPRMRSAMAGIRSEAARVMAAARRNPRMRMVGRLVPHAMRRTAVLMIRLRSAGRPVTSSVARSAFRAVLAKMIRDGRVRSVALQRARSYASRGRRSLRAMRF